jgi:hypothetical protein
MQRTQRNLLIGFGVVGLGLLLAVGVLVLRRDSHAPDVPSTNPNSSLAQAETPGLPSESSGKGSAPTVTSTDSPTTKSTPAKKAESAVPKGAGDGAAVAPPPIQRKDIGRYITLDKDPPSVLLQRGANSDLWGRLQPSNRVSTADYLMSLPGYRSRVHLDSGVYLLLWGNVPEFSPFPPVRESRVMLYDPAPGLDLDFALEWGRVHLSNHKPMGAARVRVRFQQETWEIVLPDPQSEVALELWGLYPPGVPFSKEPSAKGPLACLGLFAKGQAVLKTPQQEYRLPDRCQVVWSSTNPTPVGPQSLPQPPDWWTDKLDPQIPAIGNMMLALTDLEARLKKEEAVVDAVWTEVKESEFKQHRVLGVMCLGALDAVPHLVDCLEDRENMEVREAAAQTLRQWASRQRDNDLELFKTLHEKKKFSEEKAEIIMQLLHSISDEARRDPKTYATLIGYLNHDNLVVRDLAFWHLATLVPEIARNVPYNPTMDADKRKQAQEQWKKLLPEGRPPPTPPAGQR